MALRTGSAIWNGNLKDGNGELTVGDGVFTGAYSYASRFEDGEGTNPEELLAAAHAACFAMAFTNTLVKAGHQPNGVDITATCTFAQRGGTFSVTTMRLSARASIEGIDDAAYQDLATTAKENCPISRAIAGNVEISLHAELA
jgi:osmotically inducible protein OsmC